MFKLFMVKCIIINCFVCCCYGKPVADFQTADHAKLLSEKESTLLQLQNLLDETILKEIYFPKIKHERNPTNKEATSTISQKPADVASVSNSKRKSPSKPLPPKPPINAIPSFGDRIQEVVISPNKSPLDYNPQKPSFAGSFSNGQLSQLIPSAVPLPANPQLPNRIQDTPETVLNIKPDPQKPSFAGSFSNGQSSQLIPSGVPLPANPLLPNRIQDNPESAIHVAFDGQRPSFAGSFSSGQLSQRIPPGKPLPAGPSNVVPVKDRFEDDNGEPQIAPSTTAKSPLEYHGQKPSFAGQFSNGQPSQLIPSGSPLPAGSLNNVPVKDRFEDDNGEPLIVASTTAKSPLEYHGQRPSFAGQSSNGQPNQLIPSGSPLPGGPLNVVPVKDRFEDDNEVPLIAPSTTAESPLEYHGQRPSFAGSFSNGQLSQLIPSGSPLPAGPLNIVPVKDRFEDENEVPLIASSTTAESPLEYHGQRPSFAGSFSNGQPSQLIPSGAPLPAFPSNVIPVKDSFEDDNEEPLIAASTTSKSPLEYHGQRPSFAGNFSNGQPSQLIPSGSPLPAGPLSVVPVKDRFEDGDGEPLVAPATTTKSPLEYHGQKPSFAGNFSNGQPSQLIPSGSPLPAGPLSFVPVKDRFEDDNEVPPSTTAKSPLEYNGHRPSFAGQSSNGQPSQLIPSGSLLPAGPLNKVSAEDQSKKDDRLAISVSTSNKSHPPIPKMS